MKTKIYVLKRSNGFCGIYVNGKTQQHLESNFPLSDRGEYFFWNIIRIQNQYKNCEIIFTENEEEFKSNLPSLQEYLQGLNINTWHLNKTMLK